MDKPRTSTWLLCLLFYLIPLQATARHYPMLHYTQSDGLPSNTIYNCYQDNRGNIWFTTNKGLSCFDGISFRNLSTKDGMPDNEILTMEQLSQLRRQRFVLEIKELVDEQGQVSGVCALITIDAAV